MRLRIYNFFVNKHSGIAYRYHKVHDNSKLSGKIISYIYLLWLNFCYYFLFCHFLNYPPKWDIYEVRNLNYKKSESALRLDDNMSVDEVVDNLSRYDIVSFDIFDTLIFRPFDEPTSLFYLLGEQLGYMDFKRIRVETENEARWDKLKKEQSSEVNIFDIWNKLEEKTGLSAKKGVMLEMELEQQLCYANPFMLKVFNTLVKQGKRIIITSDMYLPQEFLEKMLESKGFLGAEKVYISNTLNMCKGNGRIFEYIRKELNIGENQMIHIGDNERSDIDMARKNGVIPCYYPNIHKKIIMFRAYDMEAVIGAAYRGLVDNHIYCGLETYSLDYEFGYIYGGLFVLGYCNFIHNYCELHNIDKILFLSRDGDIIKQAYDFLYPDANTEYVYWSRKAATKLMAQADRHDFFRRFVYHKVNQNITLADVFKSMNLYTLFETSGFNGEEYLTDKNVESVKKFLEECWEDVLAVYETEHKSARAYYGKVLSDCISAIAVDIGWAGSGAVALDYLVRNVWNIPCSITGIIAGTNTIHNTEPDASETFLLSGRLVSYMYSQSHNRDLLKKHDPNKDYNVFWELLLSSPTRQFSGFGLNEDGSVRLDFGKSDANRDGIMNIQRGILDFVKEYYSHFKDFPYMFNISGRDAYAPMLVAAGHNEKYLKAVKKRFDLDINVN